MSIEMQSSADDGTQRKAVLHCPECGHESAATGDWDVEEREERAVVSCPVCGTDIATRGRSRRLCHAC